MLRESGSSFRGLHESLINYGGNKKPEFITCIHEEASVAMAHGYFKIEGKPLLVLAHGTVGMQHASMAIYNAWCDRVPVICSAATRWTLEAPRRATEWLPFGAGRRRAWCATSPSGTTSRFRCSTSRESAVRAYKIAMTPPTSRCCWSPIANFRRGRSNDGPAARFRSYLPTTPPRAMRTRCRSRAAAGAAEHPVIVADACARTPAGMKLLVELAEAAAGAGDRPAGRMNFPNTHYL